MNWLLLTSTLAIATALGAACSSPNGGTPAPTASGSTSAPAPTSAAVVGPRAASREGGTLSRAPSDDALFLADEDHSCVRAASLPLDAASPIERTEMPGRPAQVLATGNHVLVTIREMPDGGGALLVMERAGKLGLTEKARIALPPDAWGIALSPDESLVVVTSAWSAKVSVVDLAAAKVLSTVDVAREPRGVTILPSGDTAFVSHLVGAPVTRIDRLREGSPAVRRLEVPASPSRSPLGTKLPASLGYTTLASPDGDRVYFPREALGAIGKDAWFGTAAVDVVVASTGAPFASTRQGGGAQFIEAILPAGQASPPWWDAASDVLERGGRSFVGPRAAIYRKSENTLLVASEGTNLVVELDALMSDPTFGPLRSYALGREADPFVGAVAKGGAPTGLALSADEQTLFVHCRSTDELVALPLPRGEGTYDAIPPLYRKLVDVAPTREEAMGRALFYDATDPVTSGGFACASCHPEGRDDGHVWHEVAFEEKVTNFFGGAADEVFLADRWKQPELTPKNVDGPNAVGYARQTPMLVGRVRAQGPYGWLGESKDLGSRLVAGFGLHRWQSLDSPDGPKLARAGYLTKFLRDELVAPPRVKRPLDAEEEKGKAIFLSEKAACSTCHTPDTDYTNRSSASFGDAPPLPGFHAEKGAAYKTPSLLFVGGSAPYFHDGRFDSLEELIDKNADRMGKTAHLSAEEKRALVAFLKTL